MLGWCEASSIGAPYALGMMHMQERTSAPRWMVTSALVAALHVGLGGVARAEEVAPPATHPFASPAAQSASPKHELPVKIDTERLAQRPGYKSPNTAMALSVGLTLGSWAAVAVGGNLLDDSTYLGGTLIAAGLAGAVIGPSTGHLYAGERKRALVISSVIAGGLALAYTGAALSFGSDGEGGLIYVGLAASAGAGLYGWIDADDAVDRANLRRARRLRVAVVPMTTPHSAGLSLVGAF